MTGLFRFAIFMWVIFVLIGAAIGGGVIWVIYTIITKPEVLAHWIKVVTGG